MLFSNTFTLNSGFEQFIHADITAIHDVRERFALAMQEANDGLWDWQIDKEEVYLSPRCKAMLGYKDDEIPNLLDEWIKRIHPDDISRVLAMLKDHVNSQELHFKFEFRMHHKDGSYLWILERGTSQRDPSGKPYRLFGWNTDITSLKRAEEKLEERVTERTKELSLLLKVSQAVTSTLELKPLLSTIIDQLKTVVDYTGAAILGIQEDGYHLRVLHYTGTQSSAEMGAMVHIFEEGRPYALLRQKRKPILIPDLIGTPTFSEEYHNNPGNTPDVYGDLHSWLGVPLVVNEHLIGVLTLNHKLPDFYTQHHADLTQALANQAAVALENARLYGQARTLAALQERQHLARELHDSVAQALYGINLSAQSVREALDTNPALAFAPLDYVIMHAEAGLAEIRALLFELRPESPTAEGLIKAIERQVAILRVRNRLDVRASLGPEPDVSIEVKHTLYRIAQEALHNIVKHAHATNVSVQLTQQPSALEFQVDDDGRGFRTNEIFTGHFGLQSMRERAEALDGTFTLESTPGKGTTLRVHIPISSTQKAFDGTQYALNPPSP